MAPDLPKPPTIVGESLCEGWVMHRRTHPVAHAFRYRVWMVLVDLDRLEDGSGPAWARWLASWDRGHLMNNAQVASRLCEAHIDGRPTRTLALTQPRAFGFSFNPVNFYFCYSCDDTCLAILSDVRNTPWNESHCYVLDTRGLEGEYRFAPEKRLHVSPFMPMQGEYHWRFRVSAERIRITMHFDPHYPQPCQSSPPGPFVADLALRTRALTIRAVLGAALRRPAQNLTTLLRIYWQAGRLFLKRAPFHTHPGKVRLPQ